MMLQRTSANQVKILSAGFGEGEKAMKIKCNKCGFVGEGKEFKWDKDFFQNRFVSGCPKCKNSQNPSDASMRMMPNTKHPFEFVREENTDPSPLGKVLHDADEAS